MAFALPSGLGVAHPFVLALTLASAQAPPPAMSAATADQLYAQREDLASAKRAAELWSANADTDFESAWKLARASYWLGGHGPDRERRAALARGVVAGESAVRLRPDRPEGHYWLAAAMGGLAESFGMSQGIKYRSRIKSELERVVAIDASYEQASAVTALGRWYYLVPRLFGGSRSKADEQFRRTLEQYPNSVTALFFLAESEAAQQHTQVARQLLQRIVDVPVDASWAPEIREFKARAADRLRTLPASAGEP